MNFLKKISSIFSPPYRNEEFAYWLHVRCDRCGEVIRARVDLRNDLSLNYGDREEDRIYFCRKTLIGERQCYWPVEVELTFDRRRRLIQRQAQGGQFISEEEYLQD